MKFPVRHLPSVAILSLPTRGAWIEIVGINELRLAVVSRSPHGERGLKSGSRIPYGHQIKSRSPHGERGLKFTKEVTMRNKFGVSLPTRGAWIEISGASSAKRGYFVAPHTGSVD